MQRNYLLYLASASILGALLCTITVQSKEQLAIYSIEDSTADFMSDDVFSIQQILNKDLESKKEEEEEKKKKEEAEKKKAEQKSTIKSNYNPPPINGRFRLAKHNDSDEVMINKINNRIRNLPMKGMGAYIVEQGKAFNIDPYFIVSVAIQESSGGKYQANANNLYGIKGGRGWRAFNSKEECITYFCNLISKYYLDKGLTTLESIGRKYCPDGPWAVHVNKIMSELL